MQLVVWKITQWLLKCYFYYRVYIFFVLGSNVQNTLEIQKKSYKKVKLAQFFMAIYILQQDRKNEK